MSWTLSHYRAGDLVEVRSREEILATLDERGCLDGMPFMPEMLEFCGRRFRVGAVAHKTCDPARGTRGRGLQSTVHLAGLRCDGSAHGGCQSACRLFWKDAWLKPANESPAADQAANGPRPTSARCSEAQLLASAQSPESGAGDEPRYMCQATELDEATAPLAWWDLRQYAFDVMTGNHTIGRVLRVTFLATLRRLLAHAPFGYRLCSFVNESMHQLLTGRGSPTPCATGAGGAKTPTARLDLKPGEWVRIKSKAEIEETLDKHSRNRGLLFDPEEMAPFCGGVFRVLSRVTTILDEATGKMRHLKYPCIMLEGVVCNSEYARCRLNCPRAIPSFWREIWLERVNGPGENGEGPASAEVEATSQLEV